MSEADELVLHVVSGCFTEADWTPDYWSVTITFEVDP